MDEPLEQPIDLREYLAILRIRKWTIILITLLVTGAALYFSYEQTPLYTSEARVLVTPIQTDPDEFFLQPPNLETETELVSSEPVAMLVAEDLHTSTSPADLLDGLSVSSVVDSEVLILKFTDPDPRFAQAAADSFANNYLDHRVRTSLRGLVSAVDSLQKRIDEVRGSLEEITGRIEDADRADNTELEATLESERTVLISRLSSLEERLDEADPEQSVRSGGGSVIEPASLPLSPSSPDHMQNGILGFALGLALGIGLAFLRERLDDRFRGRADLMKATEAPVLATVPQYKARKKEFKLASLEEPQSTAAEAYRSLRTSLQFLGVEEGLKTVLITSPAAGEGKTVTAANLAIAFAQADNQVILVSADLRRPTIERYFGISNEQGLTDWLVGGSQDGQLPLARPGEMDNLLVLPSGKVPPNPAEILASSKLVPLLDELSARADIVIIDSPPALPVADASILSAHVSGTVLVIDAGNTKRSATIHAQEELMRVGGRFLGSVLNAYDPAASYSYYDSHYYPGYYGDPDLTSGGRKDKKRRRLSLRR